VFPISWAPHPLSVYTKLLLDLQVTYGQTIKFLTLDAHLKQLANGHEIRVIVRHDLDTEVCLRQADELIKIEQKCNINSSWYVRVDDYQYRMESSRDLVLRLIAQGYHVGLHTAPYIHSRPLAALSEAINRFEDAFGFSPTSFTVHGFACSEILRQRRKLFLEEFARNRERFPAVCDTVQPSYDLSWGDSHFTRYRKRAYLDRGEWNRILAAKPGQSILILNHPCYWGKGGVSIPGKAI
jgi:hypothetical protein